MMLTDEEKRDIRRGKIIDAIKANRTRLGCSLLMAKYIVDAYRDGFNDAKRLIVRKP